MRTEVNRLAGTSCGNCNSNDVQQEVRRVDGFLNTRVICNSCSRVGAWVRGSDVINQARNLLYSQIF